MLVTLCCIKEVNDQGTSQVYHGLSMVYVICISSSVMYFLGLRSRKYKSYVHTHDID